MPNVTTPTVLYTLTEWEATPKDPTGKKEYEKYDYVTGETFESIAKRISLPGAPEVTAGDIQALNWGTIKVEEVNYYLRDYNGCKAEPTDAVYRLSSNDRQPWLWVPKVVPPAPVGKFRSPGKHDVGHVAPDHDDRPPKHINTLRVPPVYAITWELGDIDALFAPINLVTDAAAPWMCACVQQRLQALGYLYTPLAHSQINAHAEKCWQYYRMVHDRSHGALVIWNEPVSGQTSATVQVSGSTMTLNVSGGANAGAVSLGLGDSNTNTLGALATAINALAKGWRAEVLQNPAAPSPNLAALSAVDAAGFDKRRTLVSAGVSDAHLLGLLKAEVQNNIVTRSFPKRGVIFQNSKLPPPGEFAALRFPGGYAHTSPRINPITSPTAPPSARLSTAPTIGDPDKFFDFEIGADIAEIEAKVAEYNDPFGKIPLIATVHRLLPDGKIVPAEGVSVYFQLIEPAGLTPDNSTHAADRAPILRDRVMDYSKDGSIWLDLNNWVPPSAIPRWPPQPVVPFVMPTVGPTGKALSYKETTALKKVAERAALAAVSVSPSPSDWVTAKAQARVTQNHTPPYSDTDKDLQVSGMTASDEIKSAVRFLLQHAPPYYIEGRGPKKYVQDMLDAAEGSASDPQDPQRRNAPAQYCGKSGIPVAGAPGSGSPPKRLPGIFEVAERDGFNVNVPRSPHHRDYGNLPVAEAVKPEGGDHLYAVRARTNEKGYAGVTFAPSRCGGDTYRLRAYVGPETLEFNGKDPAGPVVDTGTLVVWRNVRLFKYFLHNPGLGNLPPELEEIFNWAQEASKRDPTYSFFDLPSVPAQGGSTVRLDKNTPGVWWRHVRDTSVQLNSPAPRAALADSDPLEPAYPAQLNGRTLVGAMNTYRPVDQVRFISVAENFRRCYCEFISDTDGPEPLPESILRTVQKAMTDKATSCGDVKITIEWDKLLFMDVRSPFLLNLRHWMHYNVLKSATAEKMTDSTGSQVQGAFLNQSYAPMLQAFGQGGVYPGFTVVQFPHSDTWDQHGLGIQGVFPSGVAGSPRTALLFFTEVRYRNKMCYSVSSNAAHELGHVLGRSHQPPMPDTPEPRHHPTQPKVAAAPAPGEDSCIMAYQGNYGDYCGKCVLAIRGWKSKEMPGA